MIGGGIRRLTFAAGHGHRRQSDRGQVWDFVFHGLLRVAVHLRVVMGRGAGSASRFGIEVFMDLSIRKRMMKSGANRTLMLVV